MHSESLVDPRHVYHGHSRIRKVATISAYGTASVFIMKLSPDGQFLVIGNDDGALEVKMLSGNNWARVGVYLTGAAVRTIVWHPTEYATFFSGSANGNIYKISVKPSEVDDVSRSVVPGFVHLLQISPNGRKLVIAYGRTISVVTDPFLQRDEIGTLIDLQVKTVDVVRSFTDYHLARAIFFLPKADETILITFFGKQGIIAYSSTEHNEAWFIPIKPDTLVGSAAISPSGERLAVLNLDNGVDFYSTSYREYISTTRIPVSSNVPQRKLIADIVFIDEDTVAFGHSDGYVGFATYGVTDRVKTLTIGGDGPKAPIQTMACGLIRKRPHVLTVVLSPLSDSERPQYQADIHINCIDAPDVSRKTDSEERQLGKRPWIISVLPKTLISTATDRTSFVGIITLAWIVALSAVFCMWISTPAPNVDVQYYRATTTQGVSVCVFTLTGTVAVGTLYPAPVESGMNRRGN